MQLLIGMSIKRYLPASGTAGFERILVNGNKRVPRPPPRINAIAFRITAVPFYSLHPSCWSRRQVRSGADPKERHGISFQPYPHGAMTRKHVKDRPIVLPARTIGRFSPERNGAPPHALGASSGQPTKGWFSAKTGPVKTTSGSVRFPTNRQHPSQDQEHEPAHHQHTHLGPEVRDGKVAPENLVVPIECPGIEGPQSGSLQMLAHDVARHHRSSQSTHR